MKNYLEQLCESRIPRKFTCAHAIMALLHLKEEPYLGRYLLQELLGLSEASVRSLLSLLKRNRLIQVNPRRKGHKLSEEGEKFIEWFTKWIIPIRDIQMTNMIPEGNTSVAFIIKSASKLVSNGVAQRDTAIRNGALGAITLVVDKTEIRFPSGEQDMNSYASNDLDKLNRVASGYSNEDVIIICWGTLQSDTESGALSAAITLLFDLLNN